MFTVETGINTIHFYTVLKRKNEEAIRKTTQKSAAFKMTYASPYTGSIEYRIADYIQEGVVITLSKSNESPWASM